MSNPTLASITAELEAVETAARGRGSLTCDHLAGRIANIRGELQQIAQPQPPAEAQAVDGLRVVTLSDAWDYANGRLSWNDLDARAVRCESAATPLSREHGSVQEMFNPSAPVGVEGLLERWRKESRRLYAEHLKSMALRPLGQSDAYDACRAELSALAQQPAACPHRERCECIGTCKHGMAGSGATEIAAAQQPAAVDGAVTGGGVVLPRYFLDFLLGQGALEGFWFGDKPATEKGQFWWRSRLRALSAQQGGES